MSADSGVDASSGALDALAVSGKARRDELVAIACVLVAVLCMAGHDALAKRLSAEYSVVMVVWFRYLVHFSVMAVGVVPRAGRRAFMSSVMLLHFARGLCLVGLSLCFIFGLRFIPLGEATAVNFLSPLFVLALCAVFFGERVRPLQWGAAFLGLLGVLIMVRPGGGLFTPAILLPVCSAALLSVYQLLTRITGRTDAPAISNLMVGLSGLVFSSLLVPFSWSSPRIEDLCWVAGMGGLGALAHMLFAHAYRKTSPAFLAPFSYAQILFAAALGYLFYRHTPDAFAALGMILIGTGGLITLFRFK